MHIKGWSVRIRRFAPVVGLLILAPWVGEYLLGNVPAGEILALPFLLPLYGGGALLIREVTRRTGRGWPTILLLGAAYGVIEAGLIDQSLFNPSFEGHSFQEVTPIPALGISAYNAMAFVVGHAVWSIGTPIAIVELLTPERKATPWLGPVGLALTVLLYLLGCAIIFSALYTSEAFLATPAQLGGAALTALALIVLAFARKVRPLIPGDRPMPSPRLLGLGSFVAVSLYTARPENWLGVALGFVFLGVAALLLGYWSRQRGWGARHHAALVSGVLLTYAWLGFVLTGLVRPNNTVAWVGNGVFALCAIGLLLWVGRAVRHVPQRSDPRAPAWG